MARIAEAVAGPGISLHWDFLTDEPFRQLLPELNPRGVPEDEWPDDTNPDGSEFDPGHFDDGYGHCRDGCDTSSDADGATFYLGPRPRNRRRLVERQRFHAGWRFCFRPHQQQASPMLAITDQ